MMAKFVGPWLIVALSLAANSAAAVEGFVVGAGTMPCGTYMKVREAEHYSVQLAEGSGSYVLATYSQGFLSGLNASAQVAGRPIKTISEPTTLLLYLDNFCRAQPLATPAVGLQTLFENNLPLFR